MQWKSIAVLLGVLALHGCGTPQAPGAALEAAPDLSQPPPAAPAAAPEAPQQAPALPWSYNFALTSHGATATGGERPQLLIDGNSTEYNGGDGYAYTDLAAKPPQSMVVTLKTAQLINTIRFLLWDQDNRFYRYKLETSSAGDGDAWKTLADHSSSGEYRSWQLISFPAESVRRIRITGTHNSANTQFHVVECQAYNIPADVKPTWEEKKDVMPSAAADTGSSASEW